VTPELPLYSRLDWHRRPKATPSGIVDKLNGETNSALADPKFKLRLAETGELIFANSPAEFRKFVVEEVKKWAKVIRSANIKPQKIGKISLLD
jgi:tripartite-type tricarboxylate transporter receptor subunit TctC